MTILTPFRSLLTAQFLSAFIDNALLLAVEAILYSHNYPSYYLPFVQSTFLFSFIISGFWVGRFADRQPKNRVLLFGNAIKLFGVLALLFGANPALAYALVGFGAAVYSPAKYGILPELAHNQDELLQANAKIEGTTILAILLGTVVGGFWADYSIQASLIMSVLFYLASLVLTINIPSQPGDKSITYHKADRNWAVRRDLKGVNIVTCFPL